MYVKQCAKPRGLYLTGSGGAMRYDVKKVILNFLSFNALTVDEARVLYVEMMEDFLYRMNQDVKIRPYLHNYPFTFENVKLRIGFEDAQRQILGDGHVALMYIGKNNELSFRGYNPETEEFYSLHREPYSEALKKVTH